MVLPSFREAGFRFSFFLFSECFWPVAKKATRREAGGWLSCCARIGLRLRMCIGHILGSYKSRSG